FKNGGRKGGRAPVMIEIAQAISDDDARAASEYFASLKPSVWTKVIETETVSKSYVGQGAMRFAVAGGGKGTSRPRTTPFAPGRDARAQPRSPFGLHRLRAGGQHRQRRGAGDDGQRQNHSLRDLSWTESQGPGRAAKHHRPAADLHGAPAQRYAERHPLRSCDGADEGRGREAHHRRHDRDRRLSRLARAVSAALRTPI